MTYTPFLVSYGKPLQEWMNSSEYTSYKEHAESAFQEIQEDQKQGKLPVLDSVSETQDLSFLEETAKKWREQFKTLVVLGTGGSSLGAQTLCALKQSAFHQTSGCRVLFMDNIDPHTFSTLFSSLEFHETAFLAISKSGTTPETLCQLLEVLPRYRPETLKEHVFVLTEPKDSPLRVLAQLYGLACFDHPLGIGGRFSVFSNVGLLPAAVAQVDIGSVRQGARAVLGSPRAALDGAVLSVMAARKGYTQNIVMPYIDRLYYLTFWFRQLWAESLGKEGQGTTPLNALGTVDQHSQLQLYLDGPRDKLFTVMATQNRTRGRLLDIPSSISGLEYLAQKTMADLLEAEQKATLETLTNRGCPARLFWLGDVSEKELGGLLMHYMLETMISAKLLGVNAFDQPAVEEGKILTRTYLKSA